VTVEWRGKYLEVHRDGTWEYAARVSGIGAAVILALTEAREIVWSNSSACPWASVRSSCPPG